MSQPDISSPAPTDMGNGLLKESPATLLTGKVRTPLGERLYMTIRTPTTTLTVFLDGASAKTWAKQLTHDAAMISGTGLITPNGHN